MTPAPITGAEAREQAEAFGFVVEPLTCGARSLGYRLRRPGRLTVPIAFGSEDAAWRMGAMLTMPALTRGASLRAPHPGARHTAGDA